MLRDNLRDYDCFNVIIRSTKREMKEASEWLIVGRTPR